MLRRVILTLLTVGLCTVSAASTVPTAQASNHLRLVVYVPGTVLTPDTSKLQAQYSKMANYLKVSARLNVPMSRHVVLDYNGSENRNGNSNTIRIISTYESRSPDLTCPAPGGPGRNIDAWKNAYTTAWGLEKLITEFKLVNNNASPQVILVGHSQGGLIARVIQLVNNGARTDLPGEYPGRCWPVFGSGVIKGVAGMGTPLLKPCGEGWPEYAFDTTRKYVTTHASLSNVAKSGQVLMMGSTPKESVDTPPASISEACATAAYRSGSTRISIYSLGFPNPVSSITVKNSVATMTTSQLHNMKVFDRFTIKGAPDIRYNKAWVVTSIVGTTARVITFNVPSSYPNQTATKGFTAAHDVPNQEHSWWVDSGKCPASIVKPSRGDGNAPMPYCGFREIVNGAPTAPWPTTFTPVDNLVDPGNPGNVWDLLARKLRLWW